ncbi:hypothetical protein LCGC14_2217580, partial [marine sediment metagenome]
MELLVETLAGATEFDGTAGRGLVTFSDLALPADLNTKPRILTISVDTGDTAITMPRIICQITRPGGVACARILIRDITVKNGFALAGCAIPVPREIVVGDVDGDQDLDLVIGNTIGTFGIVTSRLYFNDGLYTEALEKLSDLFRRNRKYSELDVARMLLWIYTSKGFYDAKGIVDVFEVLRERYPQLEIPFDKILVVGRAYRDIGEFERAYLVFRATIDASFIKDANVSAVLEDEGQFLGSIDYQEDLWREYPDTAQVTSAYFALSQALYQKAPKAHLLAEQARQLAIAKGEKPPKSSPTKVDMLTETIRLLSDFLTLYPTNPLADDAAFSIANAFLDLKQHGTVVTLCGQYSDRFADSKEFASGFRYMVALGHFWQRHHTEALTAARIVADGKSKDRDFARYIVGQIYHAEGKPGDAIQWYRKVADKYSDAKQAIDYFERKHIALEEVSIFRPGKPVELTLKYRNIKEASYQVYRVDLMKLYLREKNLSSITKVNLAGIKPLVEMTIQLGDGKDYVDKEKVARLALKDEGAYLVICRGDDLFASGLVLVTPLKIEVQEDVTSGR